VPQSNGRPAEETKAAAVAAAEQQAASKTNSEQLAGLDLLNLARKLGWTAGATGSLPFPVSAN